LGIVEFSGGMQEPKRLRRRGRPVGIRIKVAALETLCIEGKDVLPIADEFPSEGVGFVG